MSVLVNRNTRLVVQGITGKTGMFHAEQSLAYGTSVVAGVTPGKGGEVVLPKYGKGVPVYDTVAEAVKQQTRSSRRRTPASRWSCASPRASRSPT